MTVVDEAVFPLLLLNINNHVATVLIIFLGCLHCPFISAFQVLITTAPKTLTRKCGNQFHSRLTSRPTLIQHHTRSATYNHMPMMMTARSDYDEVASPMSPSSQWIVSSLNGKNYNDDNDGSSSIIASPTNFPKVPTRLILHLDINETILLGDNAGGDSRQDSIQKMIAKSAFCQIPTMSTIPTGEDDSPVSDGKMKSSSSSTSTKWEDTQQVIPTHWWDGQEFGNEYTIPPLYTGWKWPDNCCPYYRTAYKGRSKEFVDMYDGAIFRPILNACEDRLAAQQVSTQKDHSNHILPAFYATLYHLINQYGHGQQQESSSSSSSMSSTIQQQSQLSSPQPPFALVFRTFGSDIEEIAHLVTDFASGKHPDYPDVYYPPLCLSSTQLYQGRWKEEQPHHKEDFVVDDVDTDNNIGSTTSRTTTTSTSTTKNVQYQLYNLNNENELVASNDDEIVRLLQGMTVCGIRDDYPYWKTNNYIPTAGKPIWVPNYDDDKTSENDEKVYDHHVLFDDNIHNLPHDGIACVRKQVPETKTITDNDANDDHDYNNNNNNSKNNVVVFETVDGANMHEEYQGIHLIRVPTIEPVLNPNWFIEQIDIASNRLQRRLYNARNNKNNNHNKKEEEEEDGTVAT
jgi:hypothetical protein